MASILKISNEDIRKARKAGFKRKKPSKPKAKTELALENWIARYNNWVKDAKSKISDGKKLDALKKQVRDAR